MQDGMIDVGHAGAVAHDDQSVVEQAEQRTIVHVDQSIEDGRCDAQVMLPAIVGAKPRQAQVHGAAPFGELAQALDEIEKRGLLDHGGESGFCG